MCPQGRHRGQGRPRGLHLCSCLKKETYKASSVRRGPGAGALSAGRFCCQKIAILITFRTFLKPYE